MVAREPVKTSLFEFCIIHCCSFLEACVGRFVCDGSLAELRGIYPARITCSEQGGNVYGGRIQQPYLALFSKIQKENKVLQQVRSNARNITKSAHEKTE